MLHPAAVHLLKDPGKDGSVIRSQSKSEAQLRPIQAQLPLGEVEPFFVECIIGKFED